MGQIETFRRSGYLDLAVESLGKEELQTDFPRIAGLFRTVRGSKTRSCRSDKVFCFRHFWMVYEGDAVSKATWIHVPFLHSNHGPMRPKIIEKMVQALTVAVPTGAPVAKDKLHENYQGES